MKGVLIIDMCLPTGTYEEETDSVYVRIFKNGDVWRYSVCCDEPMKFLGEAKAVELNLEEDG